MKINIIGYSGSGKSTLTKYIAQYYGYPYLYLDTVNFQAHWAYRNHEEALKLVADFMQHESYVLDGNYHKFFYDRRMQEANYIIFLNFNRFTCLFRAFRRYWRNRGKVRESAADNCIDKFDFEFFMWIIKDGRSPKTIQSYQALKKQYPHKFIEIKNQKQLDHFYQHIETYLSR